MKIGFNLLVLGGVIDDGHAPVIERIKALGYDGVEIPVFEGPVADYQKLGDRLRGLGLGATAVSIMNEDCNPASADPAVRAKARERLAWVVEACAALGADTLVGPYHSAIGVFTGEPPTDAELDRSAELIHEAAGLGEKVGLHFSIEAINRFESYLFTTMDLAADYKRRVAHPNLSFMYDTFHANIEERNPVRAYVRNAKDITHIHISENDRGIPGRGHISWSPIFKAIRAADYDRWLTVEAFGRALPSLAAATRVWRDLFPDIDTLLSESIRMIRLNWDQAA